MLKNIDKTSNIRLGNYRVNILILFVVVTAFTASFFITYLFPNSKLTSWQNAENLAPKPLVLSQKSIRNFDISSVKVLTIPSRSDGNLYIFDYRSPQFCGAAGCLYSVYNESGNILLEFLANPYLPRKENLIQATDIDNSGFPCLIITQATDQENIVSRTRYCYEKGKYIRLNKSLIEVGKGLERRIN
ncbi:MAG: histidine kinase [Calothrix sp. CSU_2_0]|nr:histidine kinase [Calothrix sp. CSU_2_0]